MLLHLTLFDYIFNPAIDRAQPSRIATPQAEFSQSSGGRMYHVSSETSCSPIKESTVFFHTHIQNTSTGSMMRVLSDDEVLSVAGGPEVDIEIGG
ncbi:hypothetical protein [Undibacterium sp. Ji49W]|uniref:hypothetical protein n=1 Tax=Undibacterium sp. Ji49W TaxID=3413040 RepID=UPI003BF3C31C